MPFVVNMCCFIIIIMTQIINSESKNIDSFAELLLGQLETDYSGESEEEEIQLKNYQKYIAKEQQSLLKEEFLKERSEEEKNQVKFYDDLLKSVQILSQKL